VNAADTISQRNAAAGYERLRQSAFGERVDEPGLALLLRRGLRAWIESGVDATKKQSAARSACERPTTETSEELAQLIASMLLGTARSEAWS